MIGNRLIVAGAVATAALLALPATAQKVGVIEVQRIVQESAVGKESVARIQKIQGAKQEDLTKRQSDLRDLEKKIQEQGKSLFDATVQAVRLRLRPILMTSLAFGFGVVPLAIGTGAGAGGRNAIGTAVLGGMVASTVLGIFLVPVFFLLIRSWFQSRSRSDEAATANKESAA